MTLGQGTPVGGINGVQFKACPLEVLHQAGLTITHGLFNRAREGQTKEGKATCNASSGLTRQSQAMVLPILYKL
ncbi:hypothetical protein CJ255_15265 [Candidatus Viridilinea mediisalina]|uniref:Uncharacterized protein n=1 Tax=Candidatus Viridilinea mediisalina TaxID=2024553 RepID=A0A2A6RGF0_9CHLR|nr:hypothetical protein CJ255_15265 [Candidatus Viridilinea mediisalina]